MVMATKFRMKMRLSANSNRAENACISISKIEKEKAMSFITFLLADVFVDWIKSLLLVKHRFRALPIYGQDHAQYLSSQQSGAKSAPANVY